MGRRRRVVDGASLEVVTGSGASGTPDRSDQPGGWRADPAVIARNEAGRPGSRFAEAEVPSYRLPNPLITERGSRVGSPRAWRGRRAEILESFRTHVYGHRPAAAVHARRRFEIVEHDPTAMGGAATLKRVRVVTEHAGRSHDFEVTLFVPRAAPGPVPVFLLLNIRGAENTDPTREHRSGSWPAEQIIARGYAIAAVQVADLAPDDPSTFCDGVIGLFERSSATRPRRADAWAALSAWGWGGSRALDYFETDPDVDATRAAVVGHSRGGKAALWAAAEDERFALVVSNESGCGGAALSRRAFGETVADINRVFPHWFCRTFHQYGGAEERLPVDQHELIALIAPRAVCVGSADEDLWADPRGEFLSMAHASSVYGLWGAGAMSPAAMPGLDQPLTSMPRQYHVRRGGHDLTPQDWGYYADVADRLWG